LAASLEQKITFLLTRLEREEYHLEVVACIDSSCCDDVTIEHATRTVMQLEEIGAHEVSLTLLRTDGLDAFTREACDKYA